MVAETIISSVTRLFDTTVGAILGEQRRKDGERVPVDKISDFQRQEITMELLIGGMALAFISIIIAIAIIAYKKT